MDAEIRDLLMRAADRLSRHGQIMSDLLLADEIYKRLRNGNDPQPFEAKVEQED